MYYYLCGQTLAKKTSWWTVKMSRDTNCPETDSLMEIRHLYINLLIRLQKVLFTAL